MKLEASSGLVNVKKGSGDAGPSGKLVRFLIGWHGFGAGGDQFLGVFRIIFVAFSLGVQQFGEDLALLGRWLSGESQLKGPSETGGVIAFRSNEQTFGKHASGFDEDGVIKKNKSLLGNIGSWALGHAFLSTGSIEGDHGRVGETTADISVKASAIEFVTL
tara:strand:- start:183 stop:665 length:483 start_codon:yes stop_codon:yes gene_type:complete